MKVGDLVKLNEREYPQYRDKVALIIEERTPNIFAVLVGDTVHPHLVHKYSIEVIDESR